MIITAKQLRQIAATCEALTQVEQNDSIYNGDRNDATLINTCIAITERTTNKPLGYIVMNASSYGFQPSNPYPKERQSKEEK